MRLRPRFRIFVRPYSPGVSAENQRSPSGMSRSLNRCGKCRFLISKLFFVAVRRVNKLPEKASAQHINIFLG